MRVWVNAYWWMSSLTAVIAITQLAALSWKNTIWVKALSRYNEHNKSFFGMYHIIFVSLNKTEKYYQMLRTNLSMWTNSMDIAADALNSLAVILLLFGHIRELMNSNYYPTIVCACKQRTLTNIPFCIRKGLPIVNAVKKKKIVVSHWWRTCATMETTPNVG